MVAQDSYQDLVNLDDQTEETLSLCDLPLYNDCSDCKESFKEYQISSLSSEEDYFEFFSEDWSPTSSSLTESIVFCGKLIPRKKPISDNFLKIESNTEQKYKNPALFQWMSKSCSTSKSSKSINSVSNSKSLSSPVPEKYRYITEKCSKVAMKSLRKARWYFFMFGLAKFPTKMELRDMRRRQMRQNSMSFRQARGSERVVVERSTMKGLWGLIRALGCGGDHHGKAMVKASFGGMP